MLTQIKGLHHVTAMARDALVNNAFFVDILGLRRVKQTVNFDEPSVYHLYFGDAAGTPGTIMTHFPFPRIAAGQPGTGEVAVTAFSVPPESLDYWAQRLEAAGATDLRRFERFGERWLGFRGPEGDSLALVERADDGRAPWTGGAVPAEMAVRGFHSVVLRLQAAEGTEELLRLMGYERLDEDQGVVRLVRPAGNGADFVDIMLEPEGQRARLGAGSVHHVAFAVPDRAALAAAREVLTTAGYQITPQIDRDYFWSLYFRSPGGVLFEIATNEPGFARDEDPAALGEALKLPVQHAHLRAQLESSLPPLPAQASATGD